MGDSGQIGATELVSRPRVSIGLPVYNGAEWLEESIDSILAQTFSDFELIISDNASTDATEAICRRYAAQDPRIRFRRNPANIGGMPNAVLTFELARGEFFRWAAHDDRCAPTLLERLVEELDARPDAVICFSPTIAIDERGKVLAETIVGVTEHGMGKHRHTRRLVTDDSGVRYPTEGTAARPSDRFRDLILTKCLCEPQYGLIRTDHLRQTRRLGSYTSSDVAMLAELALHGPFHVIEEPLFYKRLLPSNRYVEKGPRRMVWGRPDLARTGQVTLPHWLLLIGQARALARVAIPPDERARCVLALAWWVRTNWRSLADDLVFAGRMLTHSRDWRRGCYAPVPWEERGWATVPSLEI